MSWCRSSRCACCAAGALAAPEDISGVPGEWDRFISHTQWNGHATTIVGGLRADIEKAGFGCWLDVNLIAATPHTRVQEVQPTKLTQVQVLPMERRLG